MQLADGGDLFFFLFFFLASHFDSILLKMGVKCSGAGVFFTSFIAICSIEEVFSFSRRGEELFLSLCRSV